VAGAQPETWRYLPHLPLEWLALAIPAAAWRTARGQARPGRLQLVGVAGCCVVVLAGAAVLETYLVPIA
jgi:hypothetical protein